VEFLQILTRVTMIRRPQTQRLFHYLSPPSPRCVKVLRIVFPGHNLGYHSTEILFTFCWTMSRLCWLGSHDLLPLHMCSSLTKTDQQAFDCDMVLVHDDDLEMLIEPCNTTVGKHFEEGDVSHYM